MNPYTQNVVDRQKAEAMRDFNELKALEMHKQYRRVRLVDHAARYVTF